MVRDIQTARLRKLLANVCLNPVTAAFGLKNDEVIRPPHSRFVDVAKITAGNRSSMLQDILAGRRTEIDHLTGALLRLARRHRVNVPTHAAFLQLIRIMQAG